jgi:zinc-finger of transposase IS204/IS1001/IS1096/IS1165
MKLSGSLRRTTCASLPAFKRVSACPERPSSTWRFGAEEVVVTVRLRRRRRVCSVCGQTGAQLEIHDRRVKRWHHLDLGANRCVIECQLRRLRCPDCGTVRLEPVPWARPDSPYTRGFEDVVAWLAQQMARPRSPGCCGSPGTRSATSCSASWPTTSTRPASPASSRSASTRSAIAAASAT